MQISFSLGDSQKSNVISQNCSSFDFIKTVPVDNQTENGERESIFEANVII